MVKAIHKLHLLISKLEKMKKISCILKNKKHRFFVAWFLTLQLMSCKSSHSKDYNTSFNYGYLPDEVRQQMMGYALIAYGIIALIVAFLINYQRSRYEFKNRTSGGVVEFSSHGAAIWHNIKGIIAKLLFWTGGLALIFGIGRNSLNNGASF